MTLPDGIIFALTAALASVSGVVSWRINRTEPWTRAIVAVLTAGCAGSALFAAATLWLQQPGDPWNGARLAPAVALNYGYTLYYPLSAGPVQSTVVGPVAFLAYWPITHFSQSPTTLILAASAGNVLIFAALILLAVRTSTKDHASRWLAGVVALQLTLYYPALRYSIFCIHSDAPGLALITTAILCLFSAEPTPNWRRTVIGALCLVLAVWAKQSLAITLLVVPFIVWWRFDLKSAARVVLSCLVAGLVVSFLFVSCFGLENLRLNMFQVPSQHPWLQVSLSTGEIYPQLSAVGFAARIKVLVAVALQIIRANWELFAGLGIVCLGLPSRKETLGRGGAAPLWWIFGLLAVSLLPAVAIGRAKLGGSVNHESFSLYFLSLALVLWLARPQGCELGTVRLRLTMVAVVLSLINLPQVFEYPSWEGAWSNQNEAAAHYTRDHPGKVYFPWNPLSSLLAEGKLYHFDYGVFDRNLGGANVSRAHLLSGLPTPRPVIARTIAHHDYILRHYFPDYVALPTSSALPGWTLFGPPAGDNLKR